MPARMSIGPSWRERVSAMHDYKCYLPHHRNSRMDDFDDGGDMSPWALLFILVMVGALCFGFLHAVVQHEEIEEAKAKAALMERQRIVESVARDLDDQRRYEEYLTRLIVKEYRGR